MKFGTRHLTDLCCDLMYGALSPLKISSFSAAMAPYHGDDRNKKSGGKTGGSSSGQNSSTSNSSSTSSASSGVWLVPCTIDSRDVHSLA